MWTPIQIHKAKLKTSTVSSVEQSWDSKGKGRQASHKDADHKVETDSLSSSDTLECDEPKFPLTSVPTPGMEYYNILFEDTKDHFYRMASLEESSVHSSSNKKTAQDSHELYMLVEQAFEKKISPDFILGIVYKRRRYDIVARDYFLLQPDKAAKFRRNSDSDACEVS